MKPDSSKYRVYSPSPFNNTDSSTSSLTRLQNFDTESPAQVLFTEQVPNYSKYSLEHKSTEKICLNSIKRQTQHDRRTLSGSFCINCLNHQKTIEELQRKQGSLSEKIVVTEKHLKQYDHLLQIKDSRLRQQESTLKTEQDLFEKEKEKLARERKRLEDDKLSLIQEKQLLMHESARIEYEFDQLSIKNDEISRLFQELELKKSEILNFEHSLSSPDKELRQSLIISRESDIQRLMDEMQSYKAESSPVISESSLDLQKSIRQKEKNKLKKAELKQFALELMEMKEKFEAEQRQNFEEFESRMSLLSETEQRVIEERRRIEENKRELEDKELVLMKMEKEFAEQVENFLQEREKGGKEGKEGKSLDNKSETPKRARTRFNNLKVECGNCQVQAAALTDLRETLADLESKVRNCQDEKNELQGKIEVLESRLKIVECSREEYENENEDLRHNLEFLKDKKKDLKGKLVDLQNIISCDDGTAKKQMERLAQELQLIKEEKSETEKENSVLISKLQILTLKCEELEQELEKNASTGFNTEHNSSVSGLLIELQVKLEKLKEKESELAELQNRLNQERQANKSAAEFIKSINEDLANQRKMLEDDKLSHEQQKIKILELEKMQKDKGKMLLDKEKEMNLYREKLIERENLLILKEKRGV